MFFFLQGFRKCFHWFMVIMKLWNVHPQGQWCGKYSFPTTTKNVYELQVQATLDCHDPFDLAYKSPNFRKIQMNGAHIICKWFEFFVVHLADRFWFGFLIVFSKWMMHFILYILVKCFCYFICSISYEWWTCHQHHSTSSG